MAIKSSGKLSFGSDIEREFGQNPKRSLGEYRIKQTIGDMSNLPLDKDIPLRSTATGPGITPTPDNNTTIRFSDFYGKKLNIIIDYFKNQHIERPSALEGYDNADEFKKTIVVGGFKLPPESTSGKKVYIHVSAIIGGKRGNRNYCALRTGRTWPAGTELNINIGNEGGLMGAGGAGGQGGSEGSDGENGGDGSSALGIQYEVTELVVQSGGFIRAGGGGGGGGGGAENDTHGAPGGRGGDGTGSPGSTELNTETGVIGGSNSGESGATGDSAGSANGGGGGGGGCHDGGTGGEGRDGGQDGNTEKGGNGGQGSAGGGQQFEGNGGTGGENGYAILRENSSYISNSEITGTISGEIGNGTVPDPRI